MENDKNRSCRESCRIKRSTARTYLFVSLRLVVCRFRLQDISKISEPNARRLISKSTVIRPKISPKITRRGYTAEGGKDFPRHPVQLSTPSSSKQTGPRFQRAGRKFGQRRTLCLEIIPLINPHLVDQFVEARDEGGMEISRVARLLRVVSFPALFLNVRSFSRDKRVTTGKVTSPGERKEEKKKNASASTMYRVRCE